MKRRTFLKSLSLLPVVPTQAMERCSEGMLYLTLDTGSMREAHTIADILNRRQIKATFFIANEPTWRGDRAMDDAWAAYWLERAREGHHFGNHTWSHATVKRELPDGDVLCRDLEGHMHEWNQARFCQELTRVADRFHDLTGHTMQPLWRAPGGHTTPRTLHWAAECGFTRHVGWAPAGFLGDELPSDRWPNELLLHRALQHIRHGDILMMHLGIRSRKDPFIRVFDPLLQGLQDRGFCFSTLA